MGTIRKALCKRTNRRETKDERRERLDLRRAQQLARRPGDRHVSLNKGTYVNPAR